MILSLNRPCVRVILFTRYPVPGRVKSRLIPALSAAGAAALHRRLTLRALRAAQAVRALRSVEVEVRFDGGTQAKMKHWLGEGPRLREQGPGDLGERMARAFQDSFIEGATAAIVIGSDCPLLRPESIGAAFEALARAPVVFGPATDGGYYLVGLRQPVPQLFRGPAWGTETVLATSVETLQRLGLKPVFLKTLNDVDRPEDLKDWRRLVETEESDLSSVSVIIPALNEAREIASTLKAASAGSPREIFVVDGGSQDRTVRLAKAGGATVLISEAGRARQMNAGAAWATGSTLLFLHADTLVPQGYIECIAKQLSRPGVVAGAFQFRVREIFRGKRFLEWTTNLRSRLSQMPYGDQALFLRRSVFEELGGFADMPLLEDYELVRRLHRLGRVITAPMAALTSGRRWQKLGWLQTTLLNQWAITRYRLGVPIERVAAAYRNGLSPHWPA